MSLENGQLKNYLLELYERSQGDSRTEISMYEIGMALGLEKNEAGTLAEDLIVDGLAELKTLAGGITITPEGVQALDIPGAPGIGSEDGTTQLGNDETLNQAASEAVLRITDQIRSACVASQASFERLEEVIFDIKTLEIQLYSPRAKTAIIREVLRSLAKGLQAQGEEQLSAKINRMIQG